MEGSRAGRSWDDTGVHDLQAGAPHSRDVNVGANVTPIHERKGPCSNQCAAIEGLVVSVPIKVVPQLAKLVQITPITSDNYGLCCANNNL